MAVAILSMVAIVLIPATAWPQPALSYGSGAGAVTDISGAIIDTGGSFVDQNGHTVHRCPPTQAYGRNSGFTLPARQTGGDGVFATSDTNPLDAAGRTETTTASADARRGVVRAFAAGDASLECSVGEASMTATGLPIAQFYDTYTVTSLPPGSSLSLRWSFRGSFSSLPTGGGGSALLSIYLLPSPLAQPTTGTPQNSWPLVYQNVSSNTSPTAIISDGGIVDVGAVFLRATNRQLAVGDTFIIGTYLQATLRTCAYGDSCNVMLRFTSDFSASASVIGDGGAVVSPTAFRPAVPMAWGWNAFGELGDGTIERAVLPPVQVHGLVDVVDIAGSGTHTVALKRDGTVWAWGANYNGDLGDGTLSGLRPTPVQVLGPGGVGVLTDAIAVAAGGDHSLALKRDGTVWAWGGNFIGELGDGATVPYYSVTPVQVAGPGGAGFLTDVVAIAADHMIGAHSLALRSDGTVWAWGYNAFGQLGDGTTTSRFMPVQVVGPGGMGFLTGALGIAAGLDHSLALKGDGTVWAWGFNENGQLGDGTTTDRSTPVQVLGPGGTGFLANVTGIAAGSEHSLALMNDGTVRAWGLNALGLLGDGSATNRSTPVQVVGPGGAGFLTDVAMIAGGVAHSVALATDGTVKAWGSQLFNGTAADSSIPVPVSGISDAVFVAGGREYSLALVLANTLIGSTVFSPVDPATGASPVTLTFSNVTQPGVTTLSVSSTGPTPRAGFQLANGLYYEITSGAMFSSVQVCIDYSGSPLVGTKPILQHYDAAAGGWVQANNPIYTPAPPALDTQVCATFGSLSPFALMQVVDHTPPTVTCSVSPNVIWPPNHQMVPVTATVTVTDDLSGPAGFTLTSVTSSEPDNGLGDGDRPNDIQRFAVGTPSTKGLLRAERSGAGAGRVYTLTYTGSDHAGNSASCATTVTVPHDQRR